MASLQEAEDEAYKRNLKDMQDDFRYGSEVFRVFSEVPGSYGNTRKKQWALMGLSGKDQEVARAPPKPSPNWTRGLGRGSSLPSFPSSTLSPLLLLLLGRGNPTPGGSTNWTRGLGRGPSLPSFPSSPLSPLLLVGLGKVETYSN